MAFVGWEARGMAVCELLYWGQEMVMAYWCLTLFSLLNRSRQMSEMIDDAEMVILDGCAHMPALEAPARCAHWIADFLARRGLL